MVCGRRPSARLPKPEEVQAQTGGDYGRTVLSNRERKEANAASIIPVSSREFQM
jgi:hypothetical protein